MAPPGPTMCCPLWAECQASSRSPPPSPASSRSAGPRLEVSGPGTFPIERQGFLICLGLDGAGCERGAWTILMEPIVGSSEPLSESQRGAGARRLARVAPELSLGPYFPLSALGNASLGPGATHISSPRPHPQRMSRGRGRWGPPGLQVAVQGVEAQDIVVSGGA